MKYKDELIRSMEWLGEKDDTFFLGQSVKYSGNAIYNTLSTLDDSKKIEARCIRSTNGNEYRY